MRPTLLHGIKIGSFIGFRHHRSECSRVADGQVSQHLAIDLDIGLFDAVHQTTVGCAVQTGSRIDARNPQFTQITLADTTIAK